MCRPAAHEPAAVADAASDGAGRGADLREENRAPFRASSLSPYRHRLRSPPSTAARDLWSRSSCGPRKVAFTRGPMTVARRRTTVLCSRETLAPATKTFTPPPTAAGPRPSSERIREAHDVRAGPNGRRAHSKGHHESLCDHRTRSSGGRRQTNQCSRQDSHPTRVASLTSRESSPGRDPSNEDRGWPRKAASE
jgi:hypothetical protein